MSSLLSEDEDEDVSHLQDGVSLLELRVLRVVQYIMHVRELLLQVLGLGPTPFFLPFDLQDSTAPKHTQRSRMNKHHMCVH